MVRLIYLLPLLLALGCASMTAKHSRTLLLDRSTGETKECTVREVRTVIAYEEYEKCIKTAEEQGYTVWSQY
jgi:hypothetical protein